MTGVQTCALPICFPVTIATEIYRIAESGIATIDNVKLAKESGASAILVGETLVKSGDPASTIAEFLSVKNS